MRMIWVILNYKISRKQAIMPSGTFTYLSQSHNSTSWLDHILCSGYVNLSSVHVRYEISISDHFPLCAAFIIDDIDIHNRYSASDNLLKNLLIGTNLIELNMCQAECSLINIDICDKLGCNVDHRDCLDRSYSLIVNAL